MSFISLMVDGQSRAESDDSDMYSDGSVELGCMAHSSNIFNDAMIDSSDFSK